MSTQPFVYISRPCTVGGAKIPRVGHSQKRRAIPIIRIYKHRIAPPIREHRAGIADCEEYDDAR